MKNKITYNYFDEFIKITDIVVKTSEILKNITMDYSTTKLDELTKEVHKFENDSDQIVHEMRNYLISDFLPPIEREDILNIVPKLDDIEDFIDEIVINFKILNITSIRGDLADYATLLVECCLQVKLAYENFKDLKNLDEASKVVIEINNLEEKGDRYFEKVISNLYSNEKDPIEIIKWTTLYNCFESAIDACESVANSMSDVILKNA